MQGKAEQPRTLVGQARSALEVVAHRAGNLRLSIPMVGEVKLPPVPDLVFLATVGALTGFGLIQWPVALIVVIGHVLATTAPSRAARGVGEGLEQA